MGEISALPGRAEDAYSEILKEPERAGVVTQNCMFSNFKFPGMI